MKRDLLNYLENIQKPWGKLFYRVVWEQLSHMNNLKILDFGSGFGFTSNHFALHNEVTAIEPNADMVEMRISENKYNQVIGDIKHLRTLSDNSFD